MLRNCSKRAILPKLPKATKPAASGILVPRRNFITSSVRLNEAYNPATIERAEDEVDVCIVGGGPAGLSAAIRLKQLEREKGNEIRVVVLEKGSEIGSHIVSGAVIEPRALDELLPEWRTLSDHPLTQPATSSRMLFLTPKHALPIPHPPQMSNNGNYIVSLSQFTRWLASIAEDMGVEIYPGFSGAQLLLSDTADSTDSWGNTVRSVRGVVTNEVGLTRDFGLKAAFEPGMAFRAKVTLLAEGAHGSLSKQAVSMYALRREAEPQTYGIGLKEVWRVDPGEYRPGEVVHTLGWPLDSQTYGGGWVYHMDGGLVSLGLVIGLDYKNPWLSPYREFQRMKHHPYLRKLLSGNSERLSYGARVLNEGGLQSVPKLNFPGGALIGCSAGFVNIAKIKGTHNAMKSGMVAAEAAYEAVYKSLQEGDAEAGLEGVREGDKEGDREGDKEASVEGGNEAGSAAADMAPYDKALHESWVHADLHEVRNLRPSFSTKLGLWGGIVYSGIDSLFLKGRVPWTFKHHAPEGKTKNSDSLQSLDSAYTQPAAQHVPIDYPPFEAPLSTDLLTSVALTGTNHAEDQPVHLRVVRTGRYMREMGVGGKEMREEERGVQGNRAVGAGVGAVRNVGEALAQNENETEGESESKNEEEGTEAAVDVKSELETRRKHVEINVGEYAGLLGRACPAGVYEYVPDESGGAESEGWNGHKLVINSQNCIHCKLCDIKVPTQDITWTVPEGGGGPKYTVT